MSGVDYLAVITAESQALAATARTSDLAAPVPSCPEWDVADLVRHVGTAHRWSEQVVETRDAVPPKSVDRKVPDDRAGLPDWLEEGASSLVAVLAVTDPDADCWTWSGDQHVRFWSRRMAFETAVHRWDGEGVAAEPSGFEAALAVDGIDEHLANLPFFRNAARGTGQTLHLHCTDVAGEWLLRLGSDGLEVEREHAKGDVALRGTASDLFLVVVGRRPPAAVERFGPEDALEPWRPVLSF